jgi:hypothetical protein
MSGATPKRQPRRVAMGKPSTPNEKRAQTMLIASMKAADDQQRRERETQERIAQLESTNARFRRKIAELESRLKVESTDRSAEGDSDTESCDAGQRKKRFFDVVVADDDGNDLEPDEGESDDYEDDDANISDVGIKRVFDEASTTKHIFRRLTGLALTELTELSCCTTKRITVMWNTARFHRNGRHMGTWRLRPYYAN